MNLADFCFKLYLWPLLADIARFKGICNNYKVTSFPYITLPPGATFPTTASASGSTLPSFPTLPPTFATLPTSATGPTAPTLPTFPTLTPTNPTQQTVLPTFQTLFPTVPSNVPTATPGIPTFPTLIPTVSITIPTVPSVTATLPTFPTIPTVPSVTATLPTIPTVPSVTATLPTFPTIPTVPSVTATLPTFPTIPTVPSVTATLPTIPTVPSVTATLPSFPTIPTVPIVTATFPTFPTIPTVPSVTATLPTFPTIPSVTATLPTFPTIPTVSSVTATLPTFPTIPTVPSVTGTLPTFPTIPSVTVTVPTFPTSNPGTVATINCPDGVVLCPTTVTPTVSFPAGPGQIDPRPANNSVTAVRQGVLPNGCPCIDSRGSAIGILLQSYQIAQNCYSPDNLPGVCINIQNCASFYRLLQTGEVGPLGSLGAYIKKSLCGYDGVDLLVCCPAQSSQAVTQSIPQFNSQFTFNSLTQGTTATGGVTTVTPYQPAPTASTSSACGVSNFTQTRVVGGGPAKVGQYPWIAALGYTGATTAIVFNCAGSLITQKHILTTAHCINNNLYLARLGEYDLSSNNDGAYPVDIVIDQKFIHEQYDAKIIFNDIAMLKLRDYAPITEQIRPICLPLNEPLRSRDLTGYQPFIAGWGAVSYQGPVSSILQEAQIPVVSTTDCERNYRVYFPNQIFDNRVICAGYGGRDSCQGDSGGPLMLPQIVSAGSASYYFVLIGLVSYGYECATDGFPGVYTRVSTYIPWIESKLNL